MSFVEYKGVKYEVDKYNRLILSGLDIEDLSELKGLEKLTSVISLSLQNNKISEIRGLANFTQLKTLYLYGNEITEIENLENLKNLKKVILSNNEITQIKGLSALINLEELNLSNNLIEEIEGLENLINLEYLDLHNNKIKEIKGLDSLAKLHTLYLNENQIEDIKNIDHLTSLRKLYLDSNKITKIKGLENFENLIWLRIGNNPIPEKILEELGGVKFDAISPQKYVEYCLQQKEEESRETQEIVLEEEKKKKFAEFDETFKELDLEWHAFTKRDTYLTNEMRLDWLQRLNKGVRFPWYYQFAIRKIRNVKVKASEFETRISNYNTAFVEKRLQLYSKFFDSKQYGIKFPLDLDQRIAVIKDDKHNLVVAGAGSGKTSVITTRIAYLVKRKDKVDTGRILALAFTNVAAREMRERLAKTYGIQTEISTFHALGRKIIQKETGHRPNLISNKSHIIKQLFSDLLKEERFQNLLLNYLLYYNEKDLEEESFAEKELYYKYMRNKSYSTLDNVQVKSISEKAIGNFFFRHNIKYRYEPLVEWVDVDEEEEDKKEKEYHPDFYLPDYDIYIEHWGLNRNLQVPKWFTSTSEDYCQNRDWKLAQFEKHQKILIETWEYEAQEGTLIENLKEKLKQKVLDIEFIPLPYEEIVEMTSEFDERKRDILDLIRNFIEIAKSNLLLEDDIARRIKTQKYSPKQLAFGKLALEVYRQYQTHLRKERLIDFNDMLNVAVELIKRNPEPYLSMYDHVLIDEFQDISYQRMELINCFVNDKSDTKLFCVGDDWQCIYQFTGSDMRFFVDFEQYFPYPEITHLKSNYRSAQNVVEMSNFLIAHNKNQIQKEIFSKTKLESKSLILFEMAPYFTDGDKIAPPYIYRLIKVLLENGARPEEIMVIGRFNYNLKNIEVFCGTYGIPFEETGPRGPTDGVRFYSAHKSKGTESKYVIITDLTAGTYGFPCEVQDSSIFEVAKRFVAKSFIEEERRLFYVALTRAKQYIFMITIQDKQSMFLNEITPFIQSIFIPSNEVWDCITSDFVPKVLKGGFGKSERPYFCTMCGGVLLERQGKYGMFLSCSNYPKCRFTFNVPENDEEKCPECGQKMVVRQGKYGKFMGCTGYPSCKYTIDLEVDTSEKAIKIILCPDCGKRLIVKNGKYGKFISCIGYPACRFAYNPTSKRSSDIRCPLCNEYLAGRKGKYGLFLGCTNYPNCKFTFNI
ncbi:MAG: topoisomerase DNA-binding C4 zinc finger domain-containing protein [Promethearchaeota archaeon]